MSLLVCPLCGKSSSYANYDPSGFALDVRVRVVKGRGRGRGFDDLGTTSIIDDSEALAGMSRRIVALVGLFYRNGHISREEVVAKVGGERTDSTEVDELEAQLADLEGDIRSLADDVWNAVETDEGEARASQLGRLRAGVTLLISELEAAKALEESGDEES